SKTNVHFMEFYIDNTIKTNITGEVDWRSNSFAIPNTATNLKWRYVKSNSTVVGSDHGWVDQVVLLKSNKSSSLPYALSAASYASNQCQFDVMSAMSQVGCTCRVDFSTNLTNWSTLATFITTNTDNFVTDTGASNSMRFYRTASP